MTCVLSGHVAVALHRQAMEAPPLSLLAGQNTEIGCHPLGSGCPCHPESPSLVIWFGAGRGRLWHTERLCTGWSLQGTQRCQVATLVVCVNSKSARKWFARGGYAGCTCQETCGTLPSVFRRVGRPCCPRCPTHWASLQRCPEGLAPRAAKSNSHLVPRAPAPRSPMGSSGLHCSRGPQRVVSDGHHQGHHPDASERPRPWAPPTPTGPGALEVGPKQLNFLQFPR